MDQLASLTRRTPRFVHDCACCIYLGDFSENGKTVDLYAHASGETPTVIARYGADGDYHSGLSFSYGASPALTEARRRAEERGLLATNPAAAHTAEIEKLRARIAELTALTVPQLTVRLTSFPESNGRRNWTAMFVRTTPWKGLVGNCGGITIDRGEYWNRVAYEAECARYLLGERDTEPDILDYAVDIKTPDEWGGEQRGGHPDRLQFFSAKLGVP